MSDKDNKRRGRYEVRAEEFRGLDVTSPVDRVPLQHAVGGENFTVRAGVLCKRQGLRQVFERLPARIDGLFAVDSDVGDTLLAYAGKTFYLLRGEAWERLPVKNLAGGTSTGGGERRILGFPSGGYLYLVGAGLYLRYGCFDGAWEIRTVEPYLPTTTEGIAPVEEDTVRRFSEPVNLLTARRRNTLFGAAAGSRWALDAPVSPVDPVEIRATVLREETLVEETYVNRPSEGGTRLYGADGAAVGSILLGAGVISLAVDTRSGGTLPSMTVTFTAASGFFGEADTGAREVIRDARVGCLFGVGGARDRLFLGGGSLHPHRILYSAAGDFSYFPDTNSLTLSTDADAVRAMLPMGDGTLAVFLCGAQTDGASVAYLFGEEETVAGESGSLVLPVFRVRAGARGECPVNAFAVAEPAGERVILSRHGVFGVELMRNLSTDVRRLAERSYGIRERLCGAELSEAALFSYAGQIYLSLGDGSGITYVADATTLARESATGTSSYAWHCFTDLPARVFCVWRDRLLFGGEDGRIRTAWEGTADLTWDRTAAGELGFDYAARRAVYGATLDGVIAEGRRIVIESHGVMSAYLEGAERIDGTRIYAGKGQTVPIRAGDAVYAAQVGEGALEEGGVYYVRDPDPVTRAFSLSRTPDGEAIVLTGVAEELCLYRELSGRALFIRDVNASARSFALSEGPTSAQLPLVGYFRGEGTESVVPLDPIATVTEVREIEASWELPPIDFGAPTRRKTLLSLSLSGRGEVRVEVTALHGGAGRDTLLGARAAEGLSLTHLTLSPWESESGRYPLRMRRVGKVRVRAVSERGACEIHGISLCARVEQEMKGVNG